MKVKDVDLGRGTIRIHGKGGKVVVLPIGFPDFKTDLAYLHPTRDDLDAGLASLNQVVRSGSEETT